MKFSRGFVGLTVAAGVVMALFARSELRASEARRTLDLHGRVSVVSADVIRDGGSIRVVLLDSAGTHLSLILDQGVDSSTPCGLFDVTRQTFGSPDRRQEVPTHERLAVKVLTRRWVHQQLWARGIFTTARLESEAQNSDHQTLLWAQRFSLGL
jgi:hypothetical protein